MTLRYLETYHKCVCDCGQEFFVRAESTFGKPKLPPHKTASTCPSCGNSEFLSDHVRHARTRKKLPVRLQTAMILFADMPNMEQSIQREKDAARLHYVHWINLRAGVNRTLKFWDEQWQRAIMPSFFQMLESLLHEQERELLHFYPPAKKDL